MVEFIPLPEDLVERLAPFVHEAYLADLSALDPDRATHRPWPELTETSRESNRSQIRGYPELLAREGLLICAEGSTAAPVLNELPPEVVERIAEHEHDRWVDREIMNAPTHRDILHWVDIDEAAREKDRQPIRRLPGLLRKVRYVVTSAPGE